MREFPRELFVGEKHFPPFASFQFGTIRRATDRHGTDTGRGREAMDPDSFRSTLSGLAFGNVMAAAARDYQKELLAQEKAQGSSTTNEEVDLDDLMDDPELEKLHADRIAALKRDAEKREVLKRQGHGEYRDITEGEFLGEVTKTEKVVCHFYHREFYRCKIMDKHLKDLAPRHFDSKFIKIDAENAPFLSTSLPSRLTGIATDRLIGFQDLGGKDDFPTKTLENLLTKKGFISKTNDEDKRQRTVRSSVVHYSDSD